MTGTSQINLSQQHDATHPGGWLQAAARLRDARRRLRAAETMAGLGFWELDLATQALWLSERAGAIIGCASGTQPADRLLSRLHADDHRALLDALTSAASGHGRFEGEYRVQKQDGPHRILLCGQRLDDNAPILFGSVREPGATAGTPKRLARLMRDDREERFRIVARVTNDAIWDWNLQTNHVWRNEGIRRLFGFSRDEIDNGVEWWAAHIHPDDRGRVLRGVYGTIEAGKEYWCEEYRLLRGNGEYAQVLDRGYLVRDGQGKPLRMIGATLDITERRQAEQEHRKAEELVREQASWLDKATDAITVVGMDDRFTYWNKGAERLFGWAREEALGRPRVELIVDDIAAYTKAERRLRQDGEWSGEIRKRHKDGRLLTVEAHWTLLRGDDGQPRSVLAIDSDVTLRKQVEREIEHLAFYDPLTRLPNRRLLLDRLQHALATSGRSGRNGALLFIDLDNFKSLNDTLGHDKGDLLLKEVAQRLGSCARKSNTVARLGGDEFVIMLEDLSPRRQTAAGQAELVGEKILATFRQPFRLAGHEYHSTPSIGVTLFDGRTRQVDDLLKRADLAMYQAKASGRNTVRFFDPEMQAAVSARVALETELRQGLQEQEFSLDYQRQADSSGATIGAEALVRWQRRGGAVMSPAQFIPLAEETGMIVRLGQWVLESACSQLARWAERQETAHLTLAVNVSAREFRHPQFVEQIDAIVARTRANPRLLKLELTESLLLDSVEGTICKMNALKARGIRFALDDFGTGYSSLCYLKRLPLDQLKIDQSFVRDVLTDQNDAAIACTILALGKTLGLQVIAEGVETVEQRDFLAKNGCHAYQGYLFSRPVPAERFVP